MRNQTTRGIVYAAAIATVLALAVPALAQPTEEWIVRYNGPVNRYDYGQEVAVDSDGNVCRNGYSQPSNGRYDWAVVCYNSDGSLKWASRVNGSDNYYDYGYDVAFGGDGSVVACGSTDELNTGYDFTVAKFNLATGAEICRAAYDGGDRGSDRAYSVTADSDGNIYATGYGDTGPNYDMITVKWDANCRQQWADHYDGPGSSYDYGRSIVLSGDESLVCAGGYTTGSGTSYDYTAICYNTRTGARTMVGRYNGPANSSDYAQWIDMDDNNNVYMTGYSYGSGSYYDIATVSWDSGGTQRWSDSYNGAGNYYDYGWSIDVEGNGNSYIAGRICQRRYYYYYGALSYSSSGGRRWVSIEDPSPSYEYAYRGALGASGDFAMTGYAYNMINSSSRYDITTLGFAGASGNHRWTMAYNGPVSYSYDYGYYMAADDSGCWYVGGYGYGPARNYDYVTIKYCEMVGCPVLTAHAGGPYTFECNGQPSQFLVDGSRSCDPNDLPLTYRWTTDCPGGRFDGPTDVQPDFTMQGNPPCPINCSVTLTVTNSLGQSASETTSVINQDTTQPVVPNLPSYSQRVECDAVPPPPLIPGVDVCDPDPDEGVNRTKTPGFCPGNYQLTDCWWAQDDCMNYWEDCRQMTVVDTTPPVVSGETEYCIWSPNHEYYCFDRREFPIAAADNCSLPVNCRFTGCPADQDDNGTGDGNTTDDCLVDRKGEWFCVRAERMGEILYGRHYTILAKCWDACGNASDELEVGDVWVPHDQETHPNCLPKN